MARKLILLAIAALVVSACAAGEIGLRSFDPELLKQLRPNTTTKQEALTLLGSPADIRAEGNKENWVYVRAVKEPRSLRPSLTPPTHSILDPREPTILKRDMREAPAPLAIKRQELTLTFQGGVLIGYQILGRPSDKPWPRELAPRR